MQQQSSGFVRLDTFRNVTEEARRELVRRVAMTHDVLRAQRGFIRDLVLQEPHKDGTSTIVTLVEWENADAVPGAVAAVGELHARERFEPAELLHRLGVVAEFGRFTPVKAESLR